LFYCCYYFFRFLLNHLFGCGCLLCRALACNSLPDDLFRRLCGLCLLAPGGRLCFCFGLRCRLFLSYLGGRFFLFYGHIPFFSFGKRCAKLNHAGQNKKYCQHYSSVIKLQRFGCPTKPVGYLHQKSPAITMRSRKVITRPEEEYNSNQTQYDPILARLPSSRSPSHV